MHWKTTALLVSVCILAGSSLLAIAGDDKTAAVKKDRKALQGLWKATKDNKASIIAIRFDGDKVVVTTKDDETYTGVCTIDPAKTPKTIDIKVTGGTAKKAQDAKGTTSLGVYEIDGAKLRWHANQPGGDERPKDLKEETHALMF